MPMVLWMSETMKREDHVDYEKLKADADNLELSHDHLFHSVLGLVEIDTDLYDPALDFSGTSGRKNCRTANEKMAVYYGTFYLHACDTFVAEHLLKTRNLEWILQNGS